MREKLGSKPRCDFPAKVKLRCSLGMGGGMEKDVYSIETITNQLPYTDRIVIKVNGSAGMF